MGDAIMALFNAPAPPARPRPARGRGAGAGHAGRHRRDRRGRAGLAALPGGDQHRAGAGRQHRQRELRNFTAIGDTVNLAARLETSAREGQVVIGPATYELVRDVAVVTPLGVLQLEGKAEPVDAFELHALSE